MNLSVIEGTQASRHENDSQLLTGLNVARLLRGEFTFKAKNYTVSNILSLNLLQIMFKSAIVPDYIETYMRGKKEKNITPH